MKVMKRVQKKLQEIEWMTQGQRAITHLDKQFMALGEKILDAIFIFGIMQQHEAHIYKDIKVRS